MSTATRQSTFSSSAATGSLPERSYFETQRDALLSELGVSLEHVLQNINKLNRSLEGVIAVGNEFSSVEALWSQFESVMDKEPEAEKEGGSSVGGEVDEEEEEDTTMTQIAGAQS